MITIRNCSAIAVVVALGLCTLAGCPRKEGKEDKSVSPPSVAVPDKGPSQVAARPVALPAGPQAKSFKDATLPFPPEGIQRPPDMTAAGKSVGKLYEAVVGPSGEGGLWDQIVFTTAEGKKIDHVAELKTSRGVILIQLRPDLAPNHVRNFLALAKAGYYEGLAFDRVERQEVDGQAWAYIEAGCPLRTGEPGAGHIGYWLKPEFTSRAIHEEGTVGAWHMIDEADTAGTRFYVTLCRAPWMDGQYTIFGKIIQGLDVAHAISKAPVREDELIFGQPRDAVTIQGVAIHTRVMEQDAATQPSQ